MKLNHNCQTYYGDVLLTPYLYIVLNTILMSLFRALANNIILPVCLPFLNCISSWLSCCVNCGNTTTNEPGKAKPEGEVKSRLQLEREVELENHALGILKFNLTNEATTFRSCLHQDHVLHKFLHEGDKNRAVCSRCFQHGCFPIQRKAEAEATETARENEANVTDQATRYTTEPMYCWLCTSLSSGPIFALCANCINYEIDQCHQNAHYYETVDDFVTVPSTASYTSLHNQANNDRNPASAAAAAPNDLEADMASSASASSSAIALNPLQASSSPVPMVKLAVHKDDIAADPEELAKAIQRLIKLAETDKYFLFFQVILVWVEFFIAIAHVYDSMISTWAKYTNVYGFLFNAALGGSIIALAKYILKFDDSYYYQLYGITSLSYTGEPMVAYLDLRHCVALLQGGTLDNERDILTACDFEPSELLPCVCLPHTRTSLTVRNRKETASVAAIQVQVNGCVHPSVVVPCAFLHHRHKQIAKFQAELSRVSTTGEDTLLMAAVLAYPAITSHIVPSFVAYIWIVLPGLLLSYVLWTGVLRPYVLRAVHYVGYRVAGYQPTRAEAITVAVMRELDSMVVALVVLFVVQTLFNWASLLYGQQHGYFGAIAQEYSLRSQTTCYVNEKFSSVLQGLTFFSWL